MSLSKYPLKRGEFTSVRAVKILSDQPARVKRFREGLYQDMLEEVYCNCTLKAGAVSIKAHLHICVESCPWILKYAKGIRVYPLLSGSCETVYSRSTFQIFNSMNIILTLN